MRSTIAAIAASGLLLAGCTGLTGTDVESDPEEALRDAIQAVGDYDGIELVLSATGDAAALADDPDDVRTAQLVLDSRIVLLATGESEEDAQFEVRVDLDGTDVFELRVLPESRLFLRADLEAFADAVDDPTMTQDLDELIDAARAFGLGDVAEVALAGGWIELTGVEQLQEFAEGFGGPGATPDDEPSDEDIERLQEQLVATFEDFVDDDVTVEYVGSEDAGERVQATTTGAALERLFRDISRIAAEAGGVDPALLGELDMDDGIPADATFTLDVWLDGGELSQVGLDLAALSDGEVPADTFLLIGISEFTGQVEEPADAEPFDLFGLISGALFGGFGDLGGPGLDDGFDADLDEGDLDVEDLDDLGEAGIDCIPQEEIDEFEELQELVDAGFLEVC